MKPERLLCAATFLLLLSSSGAMAQTDGEAGPKVHVVQSGDSLSRIAKRYGVDMRELAAWNGISDPAKLRVGQRLRLTPPDRAASAQKPNAQPASTKETAAASVQAAQTPPGSLREGSVAVPSDAVTAERAEVLPAPDISKPDATLAIASVPVAKTIEVEAPQAEAAHKQKEEVETLRQTTLNLIKLLVDSGILTQDKANELIAQARRQASQELADKATAEQKVIRVPYVPQVVRDQIKQELRDEVIAQAKSESWGAGAIPEWTERIKIGGEVRLRYQYNGFQKDNAIFLNPQATNAGNGVVLYNTTESNDLWRYQARLSVDARIADWVSAGLRISTGNTQNPVTFDQSLGNWYGSTSIVLDRAFLKFTPAEGLALNGGRMPNPFFYTNLVWDHDLNFDGVAGSYTRKLSDGTSAFGTVGAFPIEFQQCVNATQINNCNANKWLYGAQLGVEQQLPAQSKLKVGLAYYDFQGISGRFNDPVIDPASTAFVPRWMQKGNTLFNVVTNGGNPLVGLAADYKLVNLTATYELAKFDPVRVFLFGDYVENIGYNQGKTRSRTGGLVDQKGETTGYHFGLEVGSAGFEKFGDWQTFIAYKRLEADAVVDAFTDSDFHLGGTNAKGYIVGASLGLAKNTWVRARWISANEISGAPYAIDLLQVDLNARF
jgi:hypothetical protein